MKRTTRHICLGILMLPLLLGSLLLPGVIVSLRASAQDPVQEDNSHRWLYENKQVFEKLSGAARNLLERRYGNKQVASAPKAQVKTFEESRMGEQEDLMAPIPANVLVNNPAQDTSENDTQSETTIVLGGGSRVIAAFNDSNLFLSQGKLTGFSRSINQGTSWTDGGGLPSGSVGDGGDPVLGRHNALGRTYLSTLTLFSSGLHVFRSDNDAASWLAPTQGAPGLSQNDFADKEWLAVDNAPGPGNGYVYLAYRKFKDPVGGGIYFTRSTDNGATFGPNGGLLIADEGAFNVQGAYVAVGPGHAVYVFWLDQSAGEGTRNIIKVRKSTDRGLTFSAPVTVATLRGIATNGNLNLQGGFRSNSFPQAVVNPVNGHVYVVYNDLTAGADRADVYLRRSTNGGASWSSAIRINNDSTLNDQWQPAIAVSPDGTRLFMGFYDRRLDPENDLIHTFGATAVLAGTAMTVQPNFRISSQAFPVAIGQDPIIRPTYMGDYDQAVADSLYGYYTWGDNRNSNAFHGNQPDVRFAKVPLPNPIDDARFFVRQLYLDLLLREPDQGGWDGWTGQITQCGSNQACIDQKRVEVARGIWESFEFQQQPRAGGLRNPNPPPQYNNREFVRLCYLVFLQRNPDPGGWDHWTWVLNNCTAANPSNSSQCYNEIIRGFINSGEYRARFGNL
jgi:hypothetical protein